MAFLKVKLQAKKMVMTLVMTTDMMMVMMTDTTTAGMDLPQNLQTLQ